MTGSVATVLRWQWSEDPAALLAILDRGGVLAVPTESSYGLAVRPRDERGVAAVFRAKGRPPRRPLPVVVADAAQAADLGIDVDSPGWRGVASHWPAPLSLVCPLAEPVAAAVGAGSLAVRVPAHPRLRRLLRDLATPLTATSANRSGEAPILDPCRVADLLAGETGAVVDDGVLPGGPPSTLVRWAAEEARYVVLREGAYPSRRL